MVKRTRRTDGIDPAARSRARRRAAQALYAWQMSGSDMDAIIDQFRHEQDMEVADLAYFEDLLRGVEREHGVIDDALKPWLDRPIEDVDPLERAVLRMAGYELKFRSDVPYRVVLNEAIEVAKRFGADFGHTYVNGVLDHAAAAWRGSEYKPD